VGSKIVEERRDLLKATKEAFYRTISLKMKLFYEVVPKGTNPDLTGKFVEALVRCFIQDWISPYILLHGTLYPHNLDSQDAKPKQIDGIVYDPELGPAIIREGDFLVVDPAFCRGIIEIKTSYKKKIKNLEQDLQSLGRQYLVPAGASLYSAMGVVVHDPDPERKSYPDWLDRHPIFSFRLGSHCPIFILFRTDDYQPHEEAIDAMIRAIYCNIRWPRPTVLQTPVGYSAKKPGA
jgi:hypothetical protein